MADCGYWPASGAPSRYRRSLRLSALSQPLHLSRLGPTVADHGSSASACRGGPAAWAAGSPTTGDAGGDQPEPGSRASCLAPVRRLRFRVIGVLFLRGVAVWLSSWLFGWGTVVLVARLLGGTVPAVAWAAGLAGCAGGLVAAAAQAWRQRPSPQTVAALLDRANGLGGLLMSVEDGLAPGAWAARLGLVRLPDMRWRLGRGLAVLGVAVLFAAACLEMPVRDSRGPTAGRLHLDERLHDLAVQAEALAEAGRLAEPELASIRERLGALAAGADATDPAKAWEVLDHLAGALTTQASELAESALGQAADLAQAEALAEAVPGTDTTPLATASTADHTGTPAAGAAAERASALAELATALERLTTVDPALAARLPPELLAALRRNTLSAGQLRELLSGLRQYRGDLGKLLKRLAKAKLIDPKQLALCRGLCDKDPDALLLVLADAGLAAGGEFGLPGRGGVSRGRADAAMTWTTGSSEERVAYQEQLLPAARLADLEHSELVGVTATAPQPTPDAETKVGALAPGPAAGSAANTQAVLPRHRAAVNRFFARP